MSQKRKGHAPQNKVQETLSADERQRLQKIVNNVYEALNDLEEESQDEEIPPRGIIDPFIELPDRLDYPDYYQIIKTPICMNQIKRKINRKEYSSLKAFKDDIVLLCKNCRTYNEDSSVLYADAILIQKTAEEKLKEAVQDYPEWQDFDDSGSVNGGQSTAMTSAVGTPRAA